jgi:hypothetical protein
MRRYAYGKFSPNELTMVRPTLAESGEAKSACCQSETLLLKIC